MQAISSSDYQNQKAQSLDEILNSGEKKEEGKNTIKNLGKKEVTEKPKNSFEQMLKENEMKGVAKKAPKKGMQLGKPKPKANNALMQELEKQQMISKKENEAAEED